MKESEVIKETIYIDTKNMSAFSVQELEKQLNEQIKEHGLRTVFKVLKSSLQHLIPERFSCVVVSENEKPNFNSKGTMEISVSYLKSERKFWEI